MPGRKQVKEGSHTGHPAFSYIEAWVTRSTASVAASEPGSDFTSIADTEDLLPTEKTNVSTEGSIVQDLEVHDNIEVNAKMADMTKANQVAKVALEQTIKAPMAHKKTPTAHKRAPMAQKEMPRAHIEVSRTLEAPIAHISANGTPGSANGVHSETPVALNVPTAHLETPMAHIEVPILISISWPAQPQIAHTMSSSTMQEFQAWKLSMSKASQAQAQPFVDLTEPQEETVEIFDKLSRSTSAKRRRSQVQSDQTYTKVKCARLDTITSTVTSQRSLSPGRDYPRGTSTITKPSESSTVIKTSTTNKPVSGRPVQAHDLADFKTDMTSLIQDMIQSSLSSLTSQFNCSGGKGVAS